jgi:hypothetical protein
MPAVLESPDEKVTGVEVDGQPTAAIAGQDPIFMPSDPAGAGRAEVLSKGLGNISDTKARDDASIVGPLSADIQQDAYRAHKAFDAEAATSHDIPSWNEQEQKAKFATDPVKAFGSVGSVFALVAAAFTHRPMINALQGSAAAMDAIREGNEKGYKDAFTAWKANTDLAIKRHDMMHQEYQDATQLMKTDMTAGEAQLKLSALKYDDNKMKFLLENGMSDEISKLMESRAKAIDSVRKATEGNMDYQFRQKAFSTDARVASGDPQQVLAAWNQIFGKQASTAEQTAVANYVATTKPPTNDQELEQYNKGLEDLHRKFAIAGLRPGAAASASNYMMTRVPELMEEHKDDPAYTVSRAQIDANNEWQESQKSATKEGRLAARAKALQKENPGMSEAAAKAQARLESVTGGKNFTKAEMATVVNAPDLMDAMNTLYEMGDVTGLTTGKLSTLAAEYGTVNEPAAIWEAAHRKAQSALAAYEGSGKTSVKSLGILLERIPKVYQSTGFNRKLIADSMQSFAGNLQSEINLMEKEGKPLDEETLDRFNKVGIFPQSQAQRDPVQVLRKNPTALSLDQIQDLHSRARQLTPQDKKALADVIARKEKEWNDSHKPPASAARPAPAGLDPALEATVE